MPLIQGQILNNRYRIVKLLGQGGFGAVFKAWDTTLNTQCAVKESFELSPEGQRQFLREAQILAGLRHPNMLRVTDFFTLPGQGQYLVMDFVEGNDLEDLRCKAGGRLPESLVLPWIAQVCDALSYLHRQKPPVIHRDLKPANLRLMPPNEDHPQGRVILVDFGVAKVFDPAMRTTVGARAVTPGYSPHEQYGQTTAATDARTDIYALGATLYTLLTGQEPLESILRMVSDPLIPPRQLNSSISPAVASAILTAMQIDPARRFQSAVEFKAALLSPLGAVPGVRPAPQPVVNQSPYLPQSPTPAQRAGARGGGSPPTYVIPLKRPARSFTWRGAVLGAGFLVGLAILAGLAGLAMKGISDNRLTQTARAQATENAREIISTPTHSPTPLSPTHTPTLYPTATPTPIPWTPSDTPTQTLTPTQTPTLTQTPTPTSTNQGGPMVWIPAGTFQMGTGSLVHTVTLDAFIMDVYEVTNGMYAQCVAANYCSAPRETGSPTRGSYYGDSAYDNYPVVNVDWFQASAYCTWTGRRRLPTEAQWEYAARGGLAGATYPWGEGIDCTRANYDFCIGDTSEVGSYPANGYGLYDMAGNVDEWVADCYDFYYDYNYYSSSPAVNPTGPESGDNRVFRGGDCFNGEANQRVAWRSACSPIVYSGSHGFRCARSP